MSLGFKFNSLDINGNPTGVSYYLEDIFLAKETLRGNDLWTWGSNSDGQLGLGDLTHRSSPVQIGYSAELSGWKFCSVGSRFSQVIKKNGTLWSWGNDGYGQLGLGDRTNRSSPVQVGSLSNWSSVACGYRHTAAIKTDGSLWSWGQNGNGQLGLGDRTHRSSPVQVGSLSNWSSVAGGDYHTAAVKSDGTLWSWGSNNYGQLGLSDQINRSSPVQVGSLSNWSKISGGAYHTAAVKTDGTLWSCGLNSDGQLGLSDLTNRSSPVQVGALSNWSSVACGSRDHTVAIKTDGSLWTWGYNNQGQLGLGDRTNRSSPVQVGALSNWSSVACGLFHTAAIKTDGSLWSWGLNDFGQLGNNSFGTNLSSPVQIGTLSSWYSLPDGMRGGFNLALKSSFY